MFNDRLFLSSQLVARHPECSPRSADLPRWLAEAPSVPGWPAGRSPPHPLPLLYLGTKPHRRKPSTSVSLSLPKDVLSALLSALTTPPMSSERQLSCCLSHFFMGIGAQRPPTALVCFPSGQRGPLSCSPKRHRGRRNVFGEPSELPAAGAVGASPQGGAFMGRERRKTFRSHLQVTVSPRRPSVLYDTGRGWAFN